ncbi:MAG: glycosyltransferase family 2 protein [Nitrososphaeraceae archaeon]
MWTGVLRTYSVSVVMAAFNESSTVANVISGVKHTRLIDQIIVVDDVSTDGTPTKAEEMGCLVIRNNFRMGQTRSLRRGIETATTDLVITMDADMDHMPSDIPRLLYSMEENNADLVIGRRSELPRIVERVMSKLLYPKTGVVDTISGFRAIRRDTLNKVKFDDDDTWGSLFLIRCVHKGLRITEVPIQTPPRRAVSRTGGSIKVNMRMLKALVKDILCIGRLI